MEILLYSDIDNSMLSRFMNQLKGANNAPLSIRINSQGGSVVAGLAIYNLLTNYSGEVHTYIDGPAASMASAIAMAGDEITMGPLGSLMIHNVSIGPVSGDSKQLRMVAERLDSLQDTLIDLYSNRTGLSKSQVSEMMDKETWIKAEEALQMGFVDNIGEPLKAVAYFNNDMDWTKISNLVGAITGEAPEGADAKEVQALAEEAKNKAEETVKEKTSSEDPLEQLKAEVVDALAFYEHKGLMTSFAKEVAAFMEDTRKFEETFDAKIEEAATRKVNAILESIRSKSQVPAQVQDVEAVQVEKNELHEVNAMLNDFQKGFK